MSPERESRYVAAYLRRKLDVMRRWDAAATVRWVQWFMRRGRLLVAYVKGRLAGVVLVRLVDTKDQAMANYTDTNGRMAYIEATACEDGMMPVLFRMFRTVFPCADTMSWVRSKYNNRPVVIPMTRAALRFA